MNNIKSLTRKLKQLVGDARNGEALSALIEATRLHPKFAYLHHDVVLLKNRFTTLQRENNLIGERRIEEENKISRSILELIRELEEVDSRNSESLIELGQNEKNNIFALTINLQQWVKTLKYEEKDYFDYLLVNKKNKNKQQLLSEKLEDLVESMLKFGLKIQTNSSIKDSVDTIESIEELRSNLLIELIFDPKIDNGILKWFIERTKLAISKNLYHGMIDFTWERIVFSYCLSISNEYSVQIFEKIISTALEKAGKKDYEFLYLFFKYFISKLDNNVDAVGFLIKKLRNHQDDLLRNNEVDVKPNYLERLSLIIDLGVKETKFIQGKITEFAPNIVLVDCEQLPYNFYSMVFPLKNEEFDVITEVTRKVEPIYPFIFSSTNPVNQLTELLDNVNWKEQNNEFYWDIPTVYEWLVLADCTENHYPWGNELPNYEIANLSYDENIPPRRLRHSISFQRGKSKHGVVDCCGNIHELAYFDMLEYIQRHDLRLMGGCFETNWLNSSCQIIRKFVEKEGLDWGQGERRNVGIRLIKVEKKFKHMRIDTLKEFVKVLKDNRKVSRIGNLMPKGIQ